MAWTAPRTWVTGEIVTASIMNTHVRDNLLESAPAKAAAAGDLFYATAVNAIAVLAKAAADGAIIQQASSAPSWLAIGAEAQSLRVNDAATALEYITDAPPRRSGLEYLSFGSDLNDMVLSAKDILRCVPFIVRRDETYDRIGFYQTGTPSGNVRFGIYDDDAGHPGALLLETGSAAMSGGPQTISHSLTPGVYWLAAVHDDSLATIMTFVLGPFSGARSGGGFTKAHAFAALPDPFGSTTTGIPFAQFLRLS